MKKIVISLFFLCACQKVAPPTIPPPPVSVVVVEPKNIPADFEYVGVAESSHIVELRARVEGYLEKIAYKEGSLVQQGQLMFVVDPRPFQAALDEAVAMLEKAKALLWNADQKVNRFKPLYEAHAVSQKDLDDAISQQLALQAQVEAEKANVEKAALNLSFCSITAPVTAMSNQAKFREGALISPGPDSLLTTIYVLDPIWVNFAISVGDLLQSRSEREKGELIFPKDQNFSIEVVLADGTHVPARGIVDFTDPAFQQTTGTMMVRSVMANPKALLRPGEFVRVIVKGSVRPNALVVPQTAVQQGQKGMYVFVVDAKNVAHMQQVQVGPWYKDNWVIESGLQKGDVVISEGVNKVRDGQTVTVANKS